MKTEWTPYIRKKLDEIMKAKGITEKEAIQQITEQDLEEMKEAEKRFRKIERKAKARTRTKS